MKSLQCRRMGRLASSDAWERMTTGWLSIEHLCTIKQISGLDSKQGWNLAYLSQAVVMPPVVSLTPPRPPTSQRSSWMLRAILRECPTMKMAATPKSVCACRFSALICERFSPPRTQLGVAEGDVEITTDGKASDAPRRPRAEGPRRCFDSCYVILHRSTCREAASQEYQSQNIAQSATVTY